MKKTIKIFLHDEDINVAKTLREGNALLAVKKYMEIHDCTMRNAYNFVKNLYPICVPLHNSIYFKN